MAGRTPLHIAVLRNAPELVRYLTSSRGQRTPQGHSALMFAVVVQNNAAVKLLMSEEAGLRDNEGNTATQLAKRVGNKEAERLLTCNEYVRKMEAQATKTSGKDTS